MRMSQKVVVGVNRQTVTTLSALSRQSSPKRCHKQLIFAMTTLRALKDDSWLLASLFQFSARNPFNHEDVALFTYHGCPPADNVPMKKDHSRGVRCSLGCFRVAFRTLVELLFALDSAEVKCLSKIGGRCSDILRVDFHPADGVAHRRRSLALHDSLLRFSEMAAWTCH